MDYFEVIKRRRSVRAYAARPVEREKLLAILGCARQAPSAGNLQAYEIVVVVDLERKLALSQAAFGQSQVAEAAAVLVFLQDAHRSGQRYGQRGRELYAVQDATIACAQAHLAASALDVGSCWIGAFAPDPVREIVVAPLGLQPVALLTLGYPAEDASPSERRPLDTMIHWETFCSTTR